MASIGGMDLSMISASQKLTVGLANLNFDFSLVKIVAPEEYNAVGRCLSTKRRQEAEAGPLHVVARKLGALFAADIPTTPKLFLAYGQRASQIFDNPTYNLVGSRGDGAFADHIGADGTSIWAAATSGNAAIAMHLLGCMLARIWSGPESTSILSEMVDARKAALRNQISGDLFHLSDVTAAEITISREQLAAWDSSARAWLRTADAAFFKQHQQLMRVVKRFEMELPTGSDIYSVVKTVWWKSMEVAEKLLDGEPQSISSPEALLGLAAWHLYPDITVLKPRPLDIHQEDALFSNGGILTLGMNFRGSVMEKGIMWSLPLSHLRFYGEPVSKTRSLGLESERVYFADLKYLVLGAITGNWFVGSGGLSKVMDFFDALMACWMSNLLEEAEVPQWWELLWEAVQNISKAQGQARENKERLYKLGQRRGLRFLSSSLVQVPQAFGLTSFDIFIKHFTSHEVKIQHVRKTLSELIKDEALLHSGFISYKPPLSTFYTESAPAWRTRADLHMHPRHTDTYTGPVLGDEFTTIVPNRSTKKHQVRVPSNHAQDSMSSEIVWEVPFMLSPHSGQVHRCHAQSTSTGEEWALYTEVLEPLENDLTSLGERKVASRTLNPPFEGEPPELLRPSQPDWSTRVAIVCSNFREVRERQERNPELIGASDDLYDLTLALKSGSFNLFEKKSAAGQKATKINRAKKPFQWPVKPWPSSQRPKTVLEPSNDPKLVPYCLKLRDAADRSIEKVEEMGCPSKYYTPMSLARRVPKLYKRFIGDDQFSVWFPHDSGNNEDLEIHIDELIGTMQKSSESYGGVWDSLAELWTSNLSEHLQSLNALVYAAKLFDHLPEATIALSVIQNPLHLAKWAQSSPSQAHGFLELGKDFSCLAMFETGSLDIDPLELKDVMAMSAENSLFMAQYILDDPADVAEGALIRQTIGNIGRPGVSFLISAQALVALSPNYSSWKSVPYAPYDGEVEDHFAQTTLHLNFTGDEQPLNIGQAGLRDKEVFLVEAVIRAYDRDRWVADLDLAKTYRDTTSQRFMTKMRGQCGHSEAECDDHSPIQPLTAIDSWDELLDLPPNACIVRAKGNWLARQAIAAFCMQRLKPLVIASDRVCWKCIADGGHTLSNLLIIN